MILSWLKGRRRRRILAAPFPESWEPYLDALPFYVRLGDEDRLRLRDHLRILVAEKSWEGCAGLELTDEIKVTIAAQAALLILRIEHDYYRRARSILVYPSTFVLPERVEGPQGMIRVGGTAVLGLAHYRGPVVLAWDSARHGVENDEDGRNVVLHEFAHKLDMLDRCADGTPPLADREQFDAWVRIMTKEYDALVRGAERRRRTLLDKYGATNPAEFFAVATECFFEKAWQLQKRHPELYDLLKSYYRQDPASWKD